MRSTELSEGGSGSLDLELDLPEIPQDAAAFRTLRHRGPGVAGVWVWSEQLSSLFRSQLAAPLRKGGRMGAVHTVRYRPRP
jgi:hypothetical protein